MEQLPFKTLLDAFRHAVQIHPEHTALVYDNIRLTYQQVDLLSDALAGYLTSRVPAKSVIAIMLERNEYMMIAPLGAIKAGCAYLPLDPSYPPERLQFMIKDADAKLLIADEDLLPLLKDFPGPVLKTKDIRTLKPGKPKAGPKPEDLLLLLYTSGTTGTPKGCMLNHRNVITFACRHNVNVDLTESSRMTAYASFGFDAFMAELSSTLTAGATLYIVPERLRLNLPALHDFFEQNGVTHCFMTTQVATQFAINFPECKGLQAMYTGGEKLSTFPLPKYRLFNCYGPTESTCYVVSEEVKLLEDNIPIGRPLPGIHTFIVDKDGKQVPKGEAGELWVAGWQVADGYLNRPDKTAESFIANPFEEDPDYARVYRTGDIVRERADGKIEFVGRKDGQVKIRGFRIELKEVESVIREYPGIKDVTVQAFEEETVGGGKFLAAYIVSDETVDIQALNAFIADKKPPYMVPAITQQIDAIPLNVNQKVDVRALPKPEPPRKQQTEEKAAPFNVLEEVLAEIVRESTGISGFGLTEPLYYSGLSSLSALRLATELYKRYGWQADMATFAKTSTLQSIENEVLNILMSEEAKQASQQGAGEDRPQELTFQQMGLYFDCLKNPASTAYNLPFVLTFPEGVSTDQLQDALTAVLEAHPVVAAHFEQQDGKTYLVPGKPGNDIVRMTVESEEAFQKLKEGFMQPFDLGEGPLYRACIVEGPGEKLRLMIDIHHLVFDGRSYDVFLAQLTAALEGNAPAKEEYSYFQYAQDQKAFQDSPAFKEAEAFFAAQMEGYEEETGLLPDKKPEEGTVGHEAWLSKEIAAGVLERCHALGISPASFFLAATAITVSTFCGRQKVFMCTVSNGRSDLRTADSFGMFVNTMALVADIDARRSDDFLRATDKNFSDTRAYETYPFARVSSAYDFHPQVMMAYQVGLVQNPTLNGKPIEEEVITQEIPKFPLSVFVEGTEEKPVYSLAYDDSLYSEALVRSFADTLETVTRGLLKDIPLTEIPLVDGPALRTLDGFNHYQREVDTSATIVSLFRKQAAATPDAPAVLFDGKTLSYKDLDVLTDRIAAAIAARGLGREEVVSILIGRHEGMTVASLGVLKAGCAYQPLDPSYPKERLNFMIQDAGAKLLIADENLLPLLDQYKGDSLTYASLKDLPEGPLPAGPAPEDLFILLYTSGSTGVPKGVMLEQRNLVNFCAWYQAYYGLKAGDKVAAFASYGFDANMMDMYPALTCGACVCIIPEEVRHDLGALHHFFMDSGVTHSFMTTQVAVLYERNFPDNPVLKHLSGGGEKLPSIEPPKYQFHNGYGPTECTIFSSIFPVRKKEDNIPIGHALDNVNLYVSDPQLRRLPVGAAGELLIAGAGVGRGYLNRPDKTAECFIDNPYNPGQRLYRSGDIVRFRPDGEIEFVGRRDSQVKIRGFRIELKEVEAVLREMPGVKDVTVQAFDAPSGGKFLAAYLVMQEGPMDAKAAADFIRERKPPYMVPAAFIQLDAIPLNVNQKVDRKALPAATPSAMEDYVAPVGEEEKALCEIFAGILGVDKVGALDSFFDLGGTSLMVTNVLVSAEKKGLHFAYSDVFAHPSARALAAFLKGDSAAPEEDTNITEYDYSVIDKFLKGNTLDAFAHGERLSLGKNILLTGATGFLGIHVLKELLESTSDDTILWCLLRSKGRITPQRRLKEMMVYYFSSEFCEAYEKRIKTVEGDITKPETFEGLQDIDTVFNCAANVKHFSKGTDIEDINYGGVKNLVAFCEKNGAYLVHVSTESVGGLTPGLVPDILTEQCLYFGQLTDNQYVHSKFLAERHILERMTEGKLKAKIMRAGNLSPRAEDGEFQVNMRANASMGRLRALKLLGASPYQALEGQMEFSPIDESARAMVLLAQTPLENCVFNVSNNHFVPMDDVLTRLDRIDGKPLEYMENEPFLERMKEAQARPEMAGILAPLVAYQQSTSERQGVETLPSTVFTMQVLHRLGFRWSPSDAAYVDMIFDMLKTLRYFEI